VKFCVVFYKRSFISLAFPIKSSIAGGKQCTPVMYPVVKRNVPQMYPIWTFINPIRKFGVGNPAFNISVADVLQWSSSLEQTDRYPKYLSNNSLDIKDKYICNCTNPSSFGKFCEYKFYGGSTSFDDAITKQFQPLVFTKNSGKIHVGSQLHDNRPCYTTWMCESGLMCLDWRHICDGNDKRIDDCCNLAFPIIFSR
jgi:hypothetical protein